MAPCITSQPAIAGSSKHNGKVLLADDLPLRVGDRVRIVCPELPDLCVERAIGPDGTLDVPLLGPLPVAMRRPSEVARLVQGRLPFDDFPFAVELSCLGPAPGDVLISGAVKRSLRVFAPRGIGRERLLEAAQSLPDADLVLLAAPRRLRPGTVLQVASVSVERKVSVLGGVVSPGSYPPTAGLTLAAALKASGGLSGHGDPSGIVVVRSGEPIPLVMPADAAFALLPGDLVRVGLIAERHFISVKGRVAKPGTIEYAPGMTVTRALEAAGGVLPGLEGGVLVWQTGAKTFRLSLAFILQRRIPDPVLGPEDTILVVAGKP